MAEQLRAGGVWLQRAVYGECRRGRRHQGRKQDNLPGSKPDTRLDWQG